MTHLGIFGAGRIGGEVAFLASINGLCDRLVLHDSYKPLLKSQILDLEHTGVDCEITTELNEIKNCDVCVFAAGSPRDPSVKTRADLLAANIKVAHEFSSHINSFSGILISITNPMDVNNYMLWKMTKIPKERCIGFGGQLDSARFMSNLKKRGIPGNSIVMGEHGEFQVPVFSTLKGEVNEPLRDEILKELRKASMEVITGKGGTVFGPAYHIYQLIETICKDKRTIVPCSAILDGEYGESNCSLGVPAKIGKEGILSIEEWKLDSWEEKHFREAAEFVRDLCSGVNI